MIHRLSYNSEDESVTTVSSYELGAFDLTRFWKQGCCDGLELSSLRLNLSQGEVADWLPNPISLPIVSERLMTHLAQAKGRMRFLALSEKIFSGQAPVRYFLWEFLETYSVMVDERHYDPSALPDGDVFRSRLTVGSRGIFVTDRFAQTFKNQGFRPIAFIKIYETEPNQALQHNDPSCHVSCLRTPRASRGRG